MPPGIKSREEAIVWAKKTALKHMCVLVRNTERSDIRFEMVCERSRKYKKDSHKRKGYVYPKKTNRVYKTNRRKDDCPFKLVFYLRDGEKEENEWDCTVWFGRHNHRDPKDFEGH
ncbi:uncharacterized protein LOC113354555 [Papaver somniferum]|uniref:uncharacterized protein LOC113354555 n=1 Tax=Papaver somniferum TaxID=3469 RepID=UPI000E7011B3|nr:uncharacterized protein LOC113354555 [Papaver somniferum]